MQQPTWKPCKRELNDRLSTAEIDSLPRSCFAFSNARKEPMTDASHVRNALARFNQVDDASDFNRVCREVSYEMWLVYPPEPVAVRFERRGRLRQGLFDRRTALTFIESEGGDIDKRRNVGMIARLGDDGTAVAVADQNHWAADGVDCGLRVLLVVCIRSLGRLRHRHLVAIILEDVSDGFPPGAIRESSMHQDHVLNMLCHDYSPLR